MTYVPGGGGGMAIGGAVTGATEGSVLFTGFGGLLAQDNSNFFWDNTNNRLGLKTSTPAYDLELVGTTRLSGTGGSGLDGIKFGVDPILTTLPMMTVDGFYGDIKIGQDFVTGSGTIDCTGVAIVGTGTAFTANFSPGQYLYVTSISEALIVDVITDDENMTVVDAPIGGDFTGASYRFQAGTGLTISTTRGGIGPETRLGLGIISPAARVDIQADPEVFGLLVRASPFTQIANLTEWRDASDLVYTWVDPNGRLFADSPTFTSFVLPDGTSVTGILRADAFYSNSVTAGDIGMMFDITETDEKAYLIVNGLIGVTVGFNGWVGIGITGGGAPSNLFQVYDPVFTVNRIVVNNDANYVQLGKAFSETIFEGININNGADVIVQLGASADSGNETLFTLDDSDSTVSLTQPSQLIKFGINSAAPVRCLDVFGDNTIPQFRITGVGAGYADFHSDASGDLIITPSGEDVTIAGNLTISAFAAQRVVFVGSDGRLTTDSDFNFTTDTLTVTKIAATTFTGNVTVATKDIVTDTTTGTKIATNLFQKIAFHNSTPVQQRASAAQAAVATTGATLTTPYGYTTAAQADAIVTLVNEIRAALVEKGLIKGAA